MAERRMFSKRIISSDAFMDMSASAQMLYFHLSMWADDEGFVNNPKTIQRMCGADSEDMSAIIKNGLVIRFESGIIAITHWKMHNYIRGDRIKPTYCADEKAQLCVSEDGVYSFAEQKNENAGEPEREYEDDNSAQAKDSTRKGEKCDKETLIEKYGIVNVLQYEDRFKKWAEKRGRQGMPLYPTISAWMEQDKVVNSGEYSSIPDYYLSDDFLLEGF